MMPAVELMASQNKPTESVFTILNRYSRTPGSKAMILYYYK